MQVNGTLEVMIAQLTGTVIEIEDIYVIVDVGGVGYKVAATRSAQKHAKKGEGVTFSTYLHVAEGTLDLYGFANSIEKSFYLLLLSVSGIGPKLALTILDSVPVKDLANAIDEGRVDLVTQTPGVGKKLGERMLLELKGKVGPYQGDGKGAARMDANEDIVEALRSLGYKKSEALAALEKVGDEHINLEDRLKEALNFLQKK